MSRTFRSRQINPLVCSQSSRKWTLISECLDRHIAVGENFRVRELVKKIESVPDREAHDVNNPFSDNSKAMIREMDNVELFKLCETISKKQCFPMSSPLEPRSDLLHLRTPHG